ncbi:J domain-containing protein, partial [Synechococcus sp. B60.1]
EIERRKESIEVNYNQKIEQVKSELRKNLISIGIKQEEAKIDSTFHTGGCAKLFSLLFLLFVAPLPVSVIASFPNPSFDEWFQSLYASLFWLAIAIFLFYHYHYRKEYYTKQQVESARRFQDEAKKSIERLERDKNAKLSQIQLYCRSRIDYFKSLPLESLSPEFISRLSGEDQLFLLTAIKERADAEKLKEDLKLAAGVAVGIGILAVLFGLGGGFYPH